MKPSILLRSTALGGACVGFLSWAGMASAGQFDETVVGVFTDSMSGTVYGTSLWDDARIQCEVLDDPGFGVTVAYCWGGDLEGESFYCNSTEPAIIHAVETMPDYGRISAYRGGNSQCSRIYSYRGSRYLPPGVPDGQPEMVVASNSAYGSFVGTRVSSDLKQYVNCTLYDTPSFSSVTCQAKDTANHYFYCSSTSPGMLAAARTLKNYSHIKLAVSTPSTDCIEIWASNGSEYLP